MKKMLTLALVAVAAISFTGCASTGIFMPAGGISEVEGGEKVSVKTQHKNWFGFNPMKASQVEGALKELAAKCPGGQVVNGISTWEFTDYYFFMNQSMEITGTCKK